MPRASRTCAHCPAITPAGQRLCHACTRAEDTARGSSTERGYNAAHRRFRLAVLQRDPICVECHSAWSTVADHHPLSRRELVDADLDPNDPTHGRGLCKPCHDKHTAEHQPGGWHAR